MKHLFFAQDFFDARLKTEEKNKKSGPHPIVSLYINTCDEIIITTTASKEGLDIPNAKYMGQEKQALGHFSPSKIARSFGETHDEIISALNKNKAKTIEKIQKIKLSY